MSTQLEKSTEDKTHESWKVSRYNTVEVTRVIYSLRYKITSLSHIFKAIRCGGVDI